MAYSRRLLPATLGSLGNASITGSYAAVGNPFGEPARIVYFDNGTNQPVFFSLDGVNNHFFVPASSAKVFDLTTNQAADVPAFIAEGTQVYVAAVSSNPTTGSVYAGFIYGLGD